MHRSTGVQTDLGLIGKIYRYIDQQLQLGSKDMEKLSAIQHLTDGLVMQILEVIKVLGVFVNFIDVMFGWVDRNLSFRFV